MASGLQAVISGGAQNSIGSNAVSCVISGGTNNSIQMGAALSVIGGGLNNLIQTNAGASVISGGQGNTVQTNASNSNIGGGTNNVIAVSDTACVIGGGSGNFIRSNVTGVTVGGGINNVTGPGGVGTSYASVVGGGQGNNAEGDWSVVPGGFQNWALGRYSFAAGNRAKAQADGMFVWADSQNADYYVNVTNQVNFRCAGGVVFASGSGATNQTVSWTPGSGSWSFTSDRNAKEILCSVNTLAVLDKVSQLPLAEWSYKGYEQRHIGPMAQDFHAAFPFNDNDKMLNELDVQGVALAAIQGLNQKLEARGQELENRSKRLEAENAELKARLEKLEQIILQPKPN
jgi:hypothetical protein